MQTKNVILAVALAVACGAASAGVAVVYQTPTGGLGGYETRTDNRAFAGINWTFGEGPALVAGFRSVRVGRNSVEGGGVELSVPYVDGLKLGSIKVKGISGNRSVQGELGVGYSFAASSFLVTGGAFGSHLTAGADYLFTGGFKPYVGVHTQGTYKKPDRRGGPVSCGAGFNLISVDDAAFNPGGNVLNGQTCEQDVIPF